MFFSYLLLFFLSSYFKYINCSDLIIKMQNDEAKKAPMKIFFGILNDKDKKLVQIISSVQKMLNSTNQFDVVLDNFETPKTKSDINNLFDKGYSLAIFFNYDKENNIQWRLYDTADSIMLKGKNFTKNNVISESIDNLNFDFSKNREKFLESIKKFASQIWYELTQHESSFASKIAYIKKIKNFEKNNNSIVCICDYDGKNVQVISEPGNFIGLYWDLNEKNKRLFCSEFTRYNVRLISLGINKKKYPLFSFPGTCVGISLSKDNNEAVYCRSGEIWHYCYDVNEKKGKHIRLINNDGKNFYPILLKNGDVIFCTDSKKLINNCFLNKAVGPQIGIYKANEKSIELLTDGGYCISPSFSSLKNKLLYSKKINGIFQIFEYDLATKIHKQITNGKGNKIDASWSPCGNFIVFNYKLGKVSRIAIFNINLNKINFITPKNKICYSPAWSVNF